MAASRNPAPPAAPADKMLSQNTVSDMVALLHPTPPGAARADVPPPPPEPRPLTQGAARQQPAPVDLLADRAACHQRESALAAHVALVLWRRRVAGVRS